MNAEHAKLYKAIREFPMDEPGTAFPFVARLARENGWSPAFADRAVEEYKRFAFLAVAAGHPVSPSDAVDQAWHSHMTFTRSYWEKFCPEVLGRPLHHEPTRGGPEEQKKIAGWYAKTLESYRAFFGQPPPVDLWPAPRDRFAGDPRFERVNLEKRLVLSKVWLRGALMASAGGLGIGLLAVFGGRLAEGFHRAMDLRGPEFLGFYALTFGAIVVAGLFFRRTLRKPADEPVARELDLGPYEAAYLTGGEKRATHAAIASLVERGILGIVSVTHTIRRNGDAPGDSDPLENAIYLGTSSGIGSTAADLHEAAKPSLRKIRSRLARLGLLVSAGHDLLARVVPILAVVAVALLGLSKVAVGHERHRPVGFLVVLIVASGVAGLGIFGRRLERSRRGDRAVNRLTHEHQKLQAKARAQAGLTSLEVPLAAALFGLGILWGGPFDGLQEALKPPLVTPGSGGGGDGGGGCGGGGCGGCGGCGGGG